jgi:hypothetical protein
MVDEEKIKQILKDKGWAKHVYEGGSEYLLGKWRRIVEEIENGYDPNYIIEEYWNDLDTRSAIREVGLEEQVTELDERFKQAVTKADVQIRGDELDKDKFWYYGYPKKASGYFLESIKRELTK